MPAPSTTGLDLDAIVTQPRVARARALIHEQDGATLDDMRAIVRIAAPSYHEQERAHWLRDRFAGLGLRDPRIDEVGNVLARFEGKRSSLPPVVMAAHLDTVFPSTTDLTLHEADARLAAPGIADNARGVAALLAVARVLAAAAVRPVHSIDFVGTVGEEGVGDLCGVKHLFRAGAPLRDAVAFIALDGTGLGRIVQRAVGSRRLHIKICGPGGHSWADRGVPNPIHALGEAVSRASRLAHRDAPAAIAVGRIGGGTSVNAIPQEAWIEVDLRAERAADLESLEAQARSVFEQVVAAANASRRPGTASLALDIRVIGDRPSGETPTQSALVQIARAATRLLGQRVELVASSTDANVPIALGIPAIALGAGGASGRTHTTEEWYTNERGPEGVERALLTLLGVAGLAA